MRYYLGLPLKYYTSVANTYYGKLKYENVKQIVKTVIMETNIIIYSHLKEFMDFGNDIKARITYRKCIKAGKIVLALRIAKKYKLHPGQYDMTIAAIWTEIAKKQKDEKP